MVPTTGAYCVDLNLKIAILASSPLTFESLATSVKMKRITRPINSSYPRLEIKINGKPSLPVFMPTNLDKAYLPHQGNQVTTLVAYGYHAFSTPCTLTRKFGIWEYALNQQTLLNKRSCHMTWHITNSHMTF